MSQPVTIESDAIRMELWPHIGGKVSSLVDKVDGFDLLFNYPSELPEAPQYDRPYADSWYAGWDECFPAIGAGPYSGHPYDGARVPDHGELWGLPTTSTPARSGLSTTWHGLRFGYTLTRTINIDGPLMIAQYTLINRAPYAFRFVWAMHALMSMTVPVQLDLGAPAQLRIARLPRSGDAPEYVDWPFTGPDENLAMPEQLPAKRAWKVVAVDPIGAAVATVAYPTRGRVVRISYGSDDGIAAYWGVFINTGGWNGQRHLAIEPMTGHFDLLDRSIKDNSAASVDALGQVAWTVRWELAPLP
jgi:hypothetical protein